MARKMNGQEQRSGCDAGKTSTRPSLQTVKSPASRFGSRTTMAGLTSTLRACGWAAHAQRDELPAAISNIKRFDMEMLLIESGGEHPLREWLPHRVEKEKNDFD